MRSSLHRLIATCGGIGYLPLAPGTWTAAVTAAGWYGLTLSTQVIYWQWIILSLLIIAGVYSSGKVSHDIDKDPSFVVIDEAAGMWATMILVKPSLMNLAAGFLLFRFFDIAKPFGIRKAEKIKGGWGIMLDDLIAGLFANILLQIAAKYSLW